MQTTNATRSYKHPATLTGQTLRFFVSSKTNDAKPYVVVHHLPAGESVNGFPEVYRFTTVEEARQMFKKIQDSFYRRGYVKV